MPLPTKPVRFGIYEVDLAAGELRKGGLRIKLQGQPIQVLSALLEHPGEVVTREELRQRLWESNTFVDFDHNLNSAVKRLREALGDLADNPRFIETLPRHGYRFIGQMREPGQFANDIGESSSKIGLSEGVATAARTLPEPWQSGSPTVMAAASQHKLALAAGGLAALMLLGAAGFGVYSFLHRPTRTPYQNFTITQITNSGKAARAAISPDGRYVLSVVDDGGLESLWLRNVPSGSDTQVIPPSSSHYESLTFSPDGNYIYFRKAENADRSYWNLYRAPVLGGTPQTITQDIDSDITFSPNGERMAYVRADSMGRYRILTASLEGRNESVLRTGSLDSESPRSLAWSMRQAEISYPSAGGQGIDILNEHTGELHRRVALKGKFPFQVQSSLDGTSLFVLYREFENGMRGQVGFMDGSGGHIEPITRDTNSYSTLTLSADRRTLATVQARRSGSISVLPKAGTDFGAPRPLVLPANQLRQITWGADGSLLLSDYAHLLKLGDDGDTRTQLLADSGASILSPNACSTNYLVLTWAYHGGTNSQNIWRTNVDGSSPLRLTDGKFDYNPVCSLDQKWVYYMNDVDPAIYRVPLDGSRQPERMFRVPDGYITIAGALVAISRDGKTLATTIGSARDARIALFEVGTSSPPRMLSPNHLSWGGLHFTHDGRFVAYVSREKGVDNIWLQPLDGSAGHPITAFKSEQIWSFSLSPDEKNLAILRGHYDSDVVLLQDSKP